MGCQLFAVLHVFGKSGVRVEYSTREGHSDLFLETVILSAIAEHEKATARTHNHAGKSALGGKADVARECRLRRLLDPKETL
jgi:hypothetical protein